VSRPPAGRLVALFLVMTLAFVGITVRLAFLQVSRAEELQDLAFEQRVRTTLLPADRGEILDRNGEHLALSTPARDLYADPRQVVDPWGTAEQLAPVLGLRVRGLAQTLSQDTSFVYLMRGMEPAAADRIMRLGLPGVGSLETTKRSYPAGALASQVLGFVGTDGEGLTGLELAYEELLAGIAGERTYELGPSGQTIVGGIGDLRAAVAGSSVVTTIDLVLQFHVQAALEQAVEAQGARGGTVIVMDPRTAEILAMASYPWFDPNAFELSNESTYPNRAVTDAFEPGSTNKVITAAAAIQEAVLPLDERLSVPWTMRVGDYVIHDAHPHGVMRMTLGDIVAQSSNIGAVKVADLLGEESLASYLSGFGLGRASGVGFPGESDGIMLPLAEWSDTSLATMAYGQGIAATPLQMTSVFATIANDGRWIQPRLVRGIVDPTGEYRDLAPPQTRRVVTAETGQMVTRMLAFAVEHGTGLNAQVPGFQVAGKTGTARIPAPDQPGYLVGEYIASFIGYLPAGDPKVVVAVILDRPSAGYGGVAAAPLFRDVARAAIAQLRIGPAEPVAPPPHALPIP
jgi:cell division protein FtsI (penicillin-binding protein 3)